MRLAPLTLPVGRGSAPATLLPVAIGADHQRTRATLKVQDGCNAGCTFCIIPRARGGPRSVPLQDAVTAARKLEASGYREIVLTGVLLGSYGRDLLGQPTLATLIEKILSETQGLRVRISSIEPQDLRPEWFRLWGDRRLCRHLHLPLQSGSEAIIAAMRRQYSVAYYEQLVEQARATIPDVAVTTDLLVGFPGETDEHFRDTVSFVETLDFAGMHVFRYSARPGTPAARMPGQVPESEKVARSQEIRSIAEAGQARFSRRFSGTTQDVLWEREVEGVWHGLTDNHLNFFTRSPEDLHNRIVPVKLGQPFGQGLWAELTSGERARRVQA